MWLQIAQDLITALLLLVPTTPVCTALGHGVICAPTKIELRCMKPALDRPGWWDRHQEPGCPAPMQMVLVITETTRTEQAK